MANPFQSNPNPSWGSPYASGSFYPQYQQYGAQQQQQHPAHSPPSYSPHAMPPITGYQPSPNANMGRFDANSQMPPAQRFPFPPAPFNPDMLKQFATSNVPLPPPPGFPPVPIPNLGVPQFPQTFPHTNTPPFPQSSDNIPSEDPDAYDPRYPQNIMSSRQPEKPTYSLNTAYNSQRERQEDDSTSSRTASHEDQPPDPEGDFNGTTHPPILDGSAFSSQKVPILPIAENLPSQAQLPLHGRASHAETSCTQTTDALLPQSPRIAAGQKSTNPFQPRIELHHSSASNPKPFHRNYENKTAAELRQLAKGALLSLAPHNIHHADLVQEGIDTRTLTLLYEELGIKISTVYANEQSTVLPAPLDQLHEVPAGSNSPIPATRLQVPTSEKSIKSGQDRPTPTVSPSLERKDRIAQLLAAKAGRQSPARSVSDSVAPAGAFLRSSDAAATTVVLAAEGATLEPQHVVPMTTSTTQAKNLNETLQQLRAEPQIKTSRERSSTDGVALPSPFSTSIPGLFMTADDRMQLQNASANGLGQKRRRSSDGDGNDFEPVQKRQNTTSDMDEGEVMIIDSQSDDDASEGEITHEKSSVIIGQQTQEGSPHRRAQLQRSQSATEIPSTALRIQQPNSSIVSGPTTTAQSKPFGSTTVTGMTAAQISQRAEMLKARFLKQRAERQKALQDGLPNLDAEVRKTQALLAEKKIALSQFEEQIQQLKIEMANAEERKQAALIEASRLERQLQEGISGQRQYNDELQKLSTEQSISRPGQDSTKAVPPNAASMPAIETTGETSENPAAELQYRNDKRGTDDVMENGEQNPAMPPPTHDSRQSSLHRDSALSEFPPADIETAGNTFDKKARADNDNDDFTSGIHGSDLADESQHGSRPASTDRPEVPVESESPDGMDDADMINEDDTDGSASMSDSGSEVDEDEYEPADPDTAYPMEINDNASAEYDPEEAPVDPTPSAAPADEPEDYEPAENIAVESLLVRENDVASDAIHDGQVFKSNQEPTSRLLSSSTSTPQLHGSVQALAQDESTMLNPFQQRSASTPSIMRPLSNEEARQKIEYAPYQSPLSNYKSFRYNEQFNESAKEGFRSLTYSNTIDPNVPLCQTELSGDVCQDSQCEEQHFRKLQLTDDQILGQMSNTTDIKDKETRDLFTKGLKGLIADLRSRNVKEFENVANELSKYRRQFFSQKEIA